MGFVDFLDEASVENPVATKALELVDGSLSAAAEAAEAAGVIGEASGPERAIGSVHRTAQILSQT